MAKRRKKKTSRKTATKALRIAASSGLFQTAERAVIKQSNKVLDAATKQYKKLVRQAAKATNTANRRKYLAAALSAVVIAGAVATGDQIVIPPVPGIVVTTSGMTVGEQSAKFLLDKVGDNAEILAMTFHPGKLCIDRGVAFEEGVKGKSDIHVTYSEITVPGQVQNGNALTQAWLTSHPEGGARKLGIWSCWDEPTTGAVVAPGAAHDGVAFKLQRTGIDGDFCGKAAEGFGKPR